MPLYVSFRRALHGHTTIWYELLEEEKVGHGGCHEVTGGVYKHITASAQRRLSIERVGIKDGAFLATFGKGAIERARSEGRSTFFLQAHARALGDGSPTGNVGRTGKGVGYLRLRLCAQLGCPQRGGSPSVAHIGVRAARRDCDPGSLVRRGARSAGQAYQAPRRGRLRHGFLGDDSRTRPHGGR